MISFVIYKFKVLKLVNIIKFEAERNKMNLIYNIKDTISLV